MMTHFDTCLRTNSYVPNGLFLEAQKLDLIISFGHSQWSERLVHALFGATVKAG